MTIVSYFATFQNDSHQNLKIHAKDKFQNWQSKTTFIHKTGINIFKTRIFNSYRNSANIEDSYKMKFSNYNWKEIFMFIVTRWYDIPRKDDRILGNAFVNIPWPLRSLEVGSGLNQNYWCLLCQLRYTVDSVDICCNTYLIVQASDPIKRKTD